MSAVVVQRVERAMRLIQYAQQLQHNAQMMQDTVTLLRSDVRAELEEATTLARQLALSETELEDLVRRLDDGEQYVDVVDEAIRVLRTTFRIARQPAAAGADA